MIRYRYSNKLKVVEDYLESKKLSPAQRLAQSLYDEETSEEIYTEDEMEFLKVVIGMASLDKIMKKLDKKGRKKGDIVNELMENHEDYKEK